MSLHDPASAACLGLLAHGLLLLGLAESPIFRAPLPLCYSRLAHRDPWF